MDNDQFNIFGGVRARPIIILPDDEPDIDNIQSKKVKKQKKHQLRMEEKLQRQHEVKILTDDEKDDMFWQIIDSFQWRNRSDGEVDYRLIQNIIGRLTQIQKEIFTELYDRYYRRLWNRIIDMEKFADIDIKKTISHAIAMGFLYFNSVEDDTELLQFFVNQGECQSLDILLPDDMK